MPLQSQLFTTRALAEPLIAFILSSRTPEGCVAKNFKLIKIRHMITASEALVKKSGTPFARFALIRFSNTYHFDELKIFCNTTPLLADRDAFVCREAIEMLGKWRDPHLLPLLIPFLNDPDPLVCVRAITVLGKWRDPQTIPLLTPRLIDPNKNIHQAVLAALGLLKTRHILPHLTPLLTDPDANIRAITATFLGTLKSRHIGPLLRPLLADTHAGVRLAAGEALGRIKSTLPVE